MFLLVLVILITGIAIVLGITNTEFRDEIFETTGTIAEMEFEEEEWDDIKVPKKIKQSDGSSKWEMVDDKVLDYEEWDLEIKYLDSEGNEQIYKEEPMEKSDLYKKLEKNNLKVGDKVKIKTEESFTNDSLTSSNLIDILINSK